MAQGVNWGVCADGSGRGPVGAVSEGVPGEPRLHRAAAGALHRPSEQRPALAGPETGPVASQPHSSLACDQSSPGVLSRLVTSSLWSDFNQGHLYCLPDRDATLWLHSAVCIF